MNRFTTVPLSPRRVPGRFHLSRQPRPRRPPIPQDRLLGSSQQPAPSPARSVRRRIAAPRPSPSAGLLDRHPNAAVALLGSPLARSPESFVSSGRRPRRSGPILPLPDLRVHRPQVGFMHQRRRLQRVAGALPAHILARRAQQFGIHTSGVRRSSARSSPPLQACSSAVMLSTGFSLIAASAPPASSARP
jgi:hypothetical protein